MRELKAARRSGYTTSLKFYRSWPKKAWFAEREQRTTSTNPWAQGVYPTAARGDLLDRPSRSAMQLRDAGLSAKRPHARKSTDPALLDQYPEKPQ